MLRKLKFTKEAKRQFSSLENDPSQNGRFKQIRKTLKYLEIDTKHPSLHTHEYHVVKGYKGEKVWEAYAQNRTPGAYPILFYYGPDEYTPGGRISVITILAIIPHP